MLGCSFIFGLFMPTLVPPPSQPVCRTTSARLDYRRRSSVENVKTQEIVISMAHGFNRHGGYILVNELETRSLFSRVHMHGKRVLEIGCGTLPVTMAIPSTDMPRLFVASDVNLHIVAEARELEARPE